MSSRSHGLAFVGFIKVHRCRVFWAGQALERCAVGFLGWAGACVFE